MSEEKNCINCNDLYIIKIIDKKKDDVDDEDDDNEEYDHCPKCKNDLEYRINKFEECRDCYQFDFKCDYYCGDRIRIYLEEYVSKLKEEITKLKDEIIKLKEQKNIK